MICLNGICEDYDYGYKNNCAWTRWIKKCRFKLAAPKNQPLAVGSDELLSVPNGWEKGEPLVVSKRLVSQKMAWLVEQESNFDFDREITTDHIANCWFYTWEEFSNFIQWWYR